MAVYGIEGARESRELTRISMTEIIYKNESYAIIGACFEVYNDKGCGFLEPVYQECLGIEFEHQRIPAIAKPSLTLSYRGRMLKQTLRARLRLLRKNYRRTESCFRVDRRASRTALELSARNRI
jgi:23S rRNA-/tRNA-specific pseudouridylate synthase